MIPQQHRDWVEKLLAEHDVPQLPDDDDRSRRAARLDRTRRRRAQVEIALEHPIKLLVERARAAAEGHRRPRARARREGRRARAAACSRPQRQVNQGVDIIVAQGTEAGGHTGEIASMVLVAARWSTRSRRRPCSPPAASAPARRSRPRSRSAREGVWTGSIWLTVGRERHGTDRGGEAARSATSRDTVRSRALDGQAGAPAAHRVDRGVGARGLARARCRCRCSSCSSADAMRRIDKSQTDGADRHAGRPDRRHA